MSTTDSSFTSPISTRGYAKDDQHLDAACQLLQEKLDEWTKEGTLLAQAACGSQAELQPTVVPANPEDDSQAQLDELSVSDESDDGYPETFCALGAQFNIGMDKVKPHDDMLVH